MTTMNDTGRPSGTQLRALVSLLDDRDEGVVEACEKKVLDLGDEVLPFLEDVPLERGELAERAGRLALEIRCGFCERAFLDFVTASGEALDLEHGAFLLARVRRPDLDVARYRSLLDDLASRIENVGASSADPEELARVFEKILGEEESFRGDRSDYYNPDNSHIDRVLDRRLGTPIALSAVYIFVARRLSLPVFGLGMPGHFIVQCGRDGKVLLDPFNRGRRLSRSECIDLLSQQGFLVEADIVSPMTDLQILTRMVANLVHSHRRLEQQDWEGRYERLYEALAGEPLPE